MRSPGSSQVNYSVRSLCWRSRSTDVCRRVHTHAQGKKFTTNSQDKIQTSGAKDTEKNGNSASFTTQILLKDLFD